MKRKAKRDLITLAGVIVIISGIAGVNFFLHLESLKEKYTKMRVALEQKYRAEGFKVLTWEDMRDTKGTYRTGAKFDEKLTEFDEELVNICGFMSPIDQFRNVSEFMLLPVPITCYFCDAPPMRDIMRVELSEPADMVDDPIIVGGLMELNEEPKSDFFYEIRFARWNEPVSPEEMETFQEKKISGKHMEHMISGWQQRRAGESELMPGMEPPKAEDAVVIDDRMPEIRESGKGAPQVDMGELLPPMEAPPGGGDS